MTTASGKPFSEVDHYVNEDKQHIFCKYWVPKESVRGLILIVHGFGEHCSRYDIVAKVFNELGLFVFTQDLVGHGESEGYRWDISDYKIYLRDLLQHINIIKMKYPDLPLYLFGHSMGGALSILLAKENPDLFKCVVLSSPMIAKNVAFQNSLKVTMAKHISPYLPHLPAGPLDSSCISRDAEQLAKYNNDPLINHSRVMIRMAYQLYAIADQTENALPDVQFPFLLLHGDKDGLVDISGARKMMEFAKSTDKTLEEFKDCYHELLHEPDDVPQKFLIRIKTWLEQRMV